MKKIIAGAAITVATLGFATGALAFGPPYCATHAEPSITAPVAGIGTACQTAVAKGTQKFVKSFLKVRGKCLAAGEYDACPNVDDDAKVQQAAGKVAAKIASACGDTTGLSSSYQGEAGENVASCTLSQNHATVEMFVAETHGNGAQANHGQGGQAISEARNACQTAVAKAAQKFLPAILKSVDGCIEGRIKAGELTDIGGTCVGSLSPAGYSDTPTDTKTAEAIAKATSKMTATIIDACTGVPTEQIGFMFSCPGATSIADLQGCVACSAFNALFDIVEQQYDETGSVVSGAIQAAVDAGSPGDKFLIASGDYTEGVFIPAAECSNAVTSCLGDVDCPGGTCESQGDNMQFVGCGAATDDRPRIIPPLVAPPTRGFTAAGVDDLVFQGLEVTGWAADGIFVTNAEGVTFRDCLGNGDDLATPTEDSTSVYAFFPITSNNVVVEGCEVLNVRDAGIYVGQSIGINVRHNYVHDNVTGIEIENSELANVYGNVATANRHSSCRARRSRRAAVTTSSTTPRTRTTRRTSATQTRRSATCRAERASWLSRRTIRPSRTTSSCSTTRTGS
jgi:parallel beta-helix repeat protein